MKKYICGKKYEECGILKDNSCCRDCYNYDKCLDDNTICKDYNSTSKNCCSHNMYISNHVDANKLKDNIYTLDCLLEIQAILKGYENKEEYLNSLITDETKKIYKLIKKKRL